MRAHACEDISHSINQETTPVGGGFRGQIAKKGTPGKTISNTRSSLLSFRDAFKIENIQKLVEQQNSNRSFRERIKEQKTDQPTIPHW